MGSVHIIWFKFHLVLIILLLQFYNPSIRSVYGHLFKKGPTKQTDPNGKCSSKWYKPPGPQIGNMLLSPCKIEKVTIVCPSFMSKEKCDNLKNKRHGTVPFTFTAYDEISALRVVLERPKEVHFLQYFVEARKVTINGTIIGERFGNFFDRLDDGHAYLTKEDSQCHEDVCCGYPDIPDVATLCQRPWTGTYNLGADGEWSGTVDQFSWTIPDGYYGGVVFVGTFITAADEYWANVKSNILVLKEPGRINPRVGPEVDMKLYQ